VITTGAVVGSLFNNLLQMNNLNLPCTKDACLFSGVTRVYLSRTLVR